MIISHGECDQIGIHNNKRDPDVEWMKYLQTATVFIARWKRFYETCTSHTWLVEKQM